MKKIVLAILFLCSVIYTYAAPSLAALSTTLSNGNLIQISPSQSTLAHFNFWFYTGAAQGGGFEKFSMKARLVVLTSVGETTAVSNYVNLFSDGTVDRISGMFVSVTLLPKYIGKSVAVEYTYGPTLEDQSNGPYTSNPIFTIAAGEPLPYLLLTTIGIPDIPIPIGSFRIRQVVPMVTSFETVLTTSSSPALLKGQSMICENGLYRFVLQGDGNLVLYNNSSALWASNTVGKAANYLFFQGDGNLVLCSQSNGTGVVWASNIYSGPFGSPYGNYYVPSSAILVLQNDGNLMLCFPDHRSGLLGIIATTNTFGGRKSKHFGKLK
ncbi:hypothetical protein [Niabella aquatica]